MNTVQNKSKNTFNIFDMILKMTCLVLYQQINQVIGRHFWLEEATSVVQWARKMILLEPKKLVTTIINKR